MQALMRLIIGLLGRLPLSSLHALGTALGWAMYAVSARYRRTMVDNLARAGCSDPGIRRDAIASAGRMLAELPAIWLRPRDEVLGWVRRVEGARIVERALEERRGIVFITPHLGCFEVTAQIAARYFPISVLYRPPKLGFMEPLIEQGRAQHNVRLAPADVSGVRELVGALRKAEAVGILPDQVPGAGEGVWADFFGAPAYTMTLAMKLAARPNTLTVIAFGERLPAGRGFIVRLRLMPPGQEGETPERHLNRAIEELVREKPGQYLWGYNRYKKPRNAPALP